MANRGLDSSCSEALVPTVASLFHGGPMLNHGTPLERARSQLSIGALDGLLRPCHGHRLTVQGWLTENNKMFPKSVTTFPKSVTTV